MKKCAVLFLLLALTGCSGPSDPMEAGIRLRSRLQQAAVCSFEADIAADYGDEVHSFSLSCTADSKGEVTFAVTKPDTISGITGKLSSEGGMLTFTDTAVHFPLLAEEQLSPVSAPWILMRTLRGGNMVSACEEEGGILLSVDDSYEEDALRLDILLNGDGFPELADILYDGRKILSVSVENFEIL